MTNNQWTASIAAIAISVAAPTPAAAQERTYTFDLPAQDLGSAIRAFATITREQVSFNGDDLRGKRSNALKGTFPAADALQQLVRGTGVEFRQAQPGLFVITKSAVGNAGAAEPAAATPAPAPTQESEIVVTGTHIHGASGKGASPLIVIDREDLDRSGRSTVAEALAQLPQNFASPVATPFAPVQEVNLRGLGADNTLVLVDGHRIATSAAADFGFNGVDLNSIPLAAVDRIEILPDGASAIYGADATAGVVNIILKKNFTGSEISLSRGAGLHGGAGEWGASGVTGWAGGGFNLLLSGEYFNRDNLPARDRSFSETDDLTARGGRDLRSSITNPGNVFSLDGSNLPGLDAPFAGIPAGQNGQSLTPSDFQATAGQLNLQSIIGQFDDLVPATKRYALNARLDGELTKDLKLFAEAGVSHADTKSVATPEAFVVVVPQSNPFNPFGEPVLVNWLATELGPSIQDDKVDNRRALAGLEGHLWSSWNWQTSLSYSRDRFKDRLPIPIFGPVLDNLLSEADPAQALNVFGDGAVNPPAVLDQLTFGRESVDGVSSVKTASGQADGPLFRWAGREVRAALGWEYRDEHFNSTIAAFQLDPEVPSFTQTTAGRRHVAAGFVELNAPLFGPQDNVPGFRVLELQLATRFEHYSDFGDTTNSKVAVRWQPIASVTLRGSLGSSFRAPELRELFAVQETVPGLVFDPQRGNEADLVDLRFGGNPDLDPEKSRNWNLGFVWDVPFVGGLSWTTDLWGLRQTERITQLSADELLAAEAFFPDRVTRAAPTAADIAAGQPGQLLALDLTSLNASAVTERGADFGVRYHINSNVGRFDLRFDGAWIFRFNRQLTPAAPVEKLAGTLASLATGAGETTDHPQTRFRANISQTWSRGPWEAGLTEHYIGRSRDPFSTLHPMIRPEMTVDAQLNYVWPKGSRALAGTRLSLSALNLFDRKPPFRDNFFGFSTELHDPRGAFYRLSLTKPF